MKMTNVNPARKKVAITISVSKDVLKAIDKIAKDTYIPRSRLYERAIKKVYLKKKKRTYKRKKAK